MKRRNYMSVLVFLGVALVAGITWSQTAPTDTEGRLTFAHHGYITQRGVPHDGFLELRFEVYFNDELGFAETEKLEVTQGYYSAVIGDSEQGRALQALLTNKGDKVELLVVVIEGEREFPLEPPQLIRAAPFAMAVAGEAIRNENLKSGVVTDRVLADRSVSSSKLAQSAVLDSHLSDDAVTRRAISFGAVGSEELDERSLQPNHFIPNTLSGDLIRDNAIKGNHIENGSVTHDHLQTTTGLVIASQVYRVQANETSVAANAGNLAEALCDEGDMLLSGACPSTDDIRLQATQFVTWNNQQGYQCRYFNPTGRSSRVSAEALCLRNPELNP